MQTAITTKAHSGVIIALIPAPRYLRRLARVARVLPRPEPVSEMHLTLCYLGDRAELEPQRARIVATLVAFAQQAPYGSVSFTIDGAGRFATPEQDGTNAIYAAVRGEAVGDLRRDLVSFLEAQGVAVDQTFPSFTPHITLGYVPADQPVAAPPVLTQTVTCAWLYLCWGTERLIVPLGGAPALKAVSGPLAQPAHGPGGLLSNAALDRPVITAVMRKSIAARKRLKAIDPTELLRAEKAGERIAGQLCRSATGLFVNCNSPQATQESKDKLKKAASQQKRDAKRQEAIDAMADADLGLSPSGGKNLLAFSDGGALDAQQAQGLAELGMVETGADGQTHLTAAGRSAVAAMNRGDSRAAIDAVARGQERVAKQAERQTKQQARAAEQAAKRQAAADKRADADKKKQEAADKKKKGGGGGGGAKNDEADDDKKKKEAAARAQRRLARALRRTATTGQGTATKARRGHTYWRAYQAERKAGRPVDAARLAARMAVRRRDLSRAERARLASLRSLQLATKAAPAAGGVFTVYKTAAGQLRWLGFSSNGYEDRDGEWVSTKALAADVARTDANGQYGPLRWWHEGSPDATDPATPWGPGVDLGWCDFSAMEGPFLIESGTFISDQIGQAVARKADDLALSLGFFHPANQPAGRVFTDIRRFERSLAPKARVSNRLTAFTVPTKEQPMDAIKKKEFQRLFPEVPSDALDALVAKYTASATKAAQQQGLTLKASSTAVLTLEDGTQGVIVGGRFVRLKAPLDAAAPAAELALEDEAKADEELTVEEAIEEPAPEGDYAGDMTVDAFRAMLTDALKEALTPLLTQMKMSEKMEGMLKMMGEEMKATMGGMAKKTADADQVATIATTLDETRAALKTAQEQLAELRGETPRGVQRASQAAPVDLPGADSFTVKTPTGQPAYRSAFDEVGALLSGGPV